MDTQQKLLGHEEGVKVHLLNSHGERWPFKPQVQAYCGLREDRDVYLVHENKNSGGDCDDFAPAHEQSPRPCETCVHRQVADGPARNHQDLMDAISPSNFYHDAEFQRSRSDIITGNIQTLMQVSQSQEAEEMLMALHTGGTLPRPPSYHACCAKYSSPGKYVICNMQNPHGRCVAWSGYSYTPSGVQPSAAQAPSQAAPPAGRPAGGNRSTFFRELARRLAEDLNKG